MIAIDFSEDSKEALLWAARYAAARDTELQLLHVVHDLASNPGFYKKPKDLQMEPLQDVAETMMQEFLAGIVADEPEFAFLETLETHFIRGLPPTRIVEVARLLDVDLIVVGSRGKTGLPHRLVGSTSERVVELASAPVVVVKSEHHGKLDEKDRKRRKKLLKKDRKKLIDILGLGKRSDNGDKN